MMDRSLMERGLVILSLIVVLAVNWAANAVPLAGIRTGEVSALYASYFTPAGFTFGIWAVIYTGLLAYMVYQALPQRPHAARLSVIGRLFIVSCLCNASWLMAWHYQLLALSLVVMLCLLATLILIYRQLGKWGDISPVVRTPFSLYLAWICVATLANISSLQSSMQWNDVLLSHVQWTLAKLALAAAVAAVVSLRSRDPVFALVIAWAAYGISVKQVAVPEVQGAALVVAMISLLLAGIVVTRFSNDRLSG